MAKGQVRKIEGYKPWSAETLKAAETIPLQDDGRVKPLSTFAGFSMLRLHGARSMKIEGAMARNIRLSQQLGSWIHFSARKLLSNCLHSGSITRPY
ncbi:MAG: hypothetical protein HC845_13595 [Akkermansiaceae bacterium]|nr:hypothetical protein [Akkermansiaceae bacterium]